MIISPVCDVSYGGNTTFHFSLFTECNVCPGRNGPFEGRKSPSRQGSTEDPEDVLRIGSIPQFDCAYRTGNHGGVRVKDEMGVRIVVSIQNNSAASGNIEGASTIVSCCERCGVPQFGRYKRGISFVGHDILREVETPTGKTHFPAGDFGAGAETDASSSVDSEQVSAETLLGEE